MAQDVDQALSGSGGMMLERTQPRHFDVDANRTNRDGFAHIKSVVPPELLEEASRIAHEYGKADNVHATPLFSFLVERLRVHEVARAAIGAPIFYFGWSTVMLDVNAAPGPLHDDAKGSPIPKDAKPIALFRMRGRAHDMDRHDPWPVWRFFIYLNDHEHHSGGTKVRRQSHRKHALFTKAGLRALFRGKFNRLLVPGLGYFNPPVRPGDAVLFNLKVRHAGHFVRLRKPFHRLALPVFLDNAIKRATLGSSFGRRVLSLFAYPFPDQRTSLVIDFCTDSDWARGFQFDRLTYSQNERHKDQFFDCAEPAFAARLGGVGLPILESPLMKETAKFVRGA